MQRYEITGFSENRMQQYKTRFTKNILLYLFNWRVAGKKKYQRGFQFSKLLSPCANLKSRKYPV